MFDIMRDKLQQIYSKDNVQRPVELPRSNFKYGKNEISNSNSNIPNLDRTKSKSWSVTSFGSKESEEAYVSGMLKGYERGMKISSAPADQASSKTVPKRDSCSQVPDVQIKIDEDHGDKGDEVTSQPEKNDPSGGKLLFPGIVKSESYRDRLDKCLFRNESRLKMKAKLGCARSAKIHAALLNNPGFLESLSQVMERKHRDSIDNTGAKSFTAMSHNERADLLTELYNPVFQEKLESMIKNLIKDKSLQDQLPTMQLPPISAFPPACSDKESIDLGKILALSDDIQNMVEYWRTHSLLSLNSGNVNSGGSAERNSIAEPTKTVELEQVTLEEKGEEHTDSMISGKQSSDLNSHGSSETSIGGSETSTMTSVSEETEISSEEEEWSTPQRSDILKHLEVGQITKLATSSGNLVTYEIVCLTTPGLVVEKCWLYWKVVAIVALSSAERDGRVQVGDILFDIDGRSLRGVDKNAVRQMLSSYHSGRIMHLTLLKRSHKPDNTGKRLLATRSIARFASKCQFLVDDEIRYSTRFKSALEAGDFK